MWNIWSESWGFRFFQHQKGWNLIASHLIAWAPLNLTLMQAYQWLAFLLCKYKKENRGGSSGDHQTLPGSLHEAVYDMLPGYCGLPGIRRRITHSLCLVQIYEHRRLLHTILSMLTGRDTPDFQMGAFSALPFFMVKQVLYHEAMSLLSLPSNMCFKMPDCRYLVWDAETRL